MAERRMFAKTIIDSDAFLEMPLSTQALYFHLSMRADDDGFINSPNRIQRLTGATIDDLKLLIAKNFIIPFETGVVVIKHWKIHNYIQKDRYHETKYTEEKACLITKDNGSYTLMDTGCIQNGYKMDTEVRLGKVSLGKDRLVEEGASVSAIPEPGEDLFRQVIDLWNSQECTTSIKDIRPLSKRYDNTKLCIGYHTKDVYLDIIRSLDEQAWFKDRAMKNDLLKYDWFCQPDNFQKVLEGNYKDMRNEKNLEGYEFVDLSEVRI